MHLPGCRQSQTSSVRIDPRRMSGPVGEPGSRRRAGSESSVGQEPAARSMFRGSRTVCSASRNRPVHPAVTVPPMAFHDDRTVLASHGMVCTVDHLASSAGVAVLRAGGSAADAAVAAGAVLAVTTQHMCGMGGDLFVLVHSGGPSPAALASSGDAGNPDAAYSRAPTTTSGPV